MRAYGPPQIERYRAEDFSRLVKLRRVRKAGKHRRAAMLH